MGQVDYPNFLDDLVVDELIARLDLINRRFTRTALIGQTTGKQRARLAETGKLGRIFSSPHNVVFDPALVPFADGSLDAVIALGDLVTANDPVGTFIQARRALKGDGLFLAILACEATLWELREALAFADRQTNGKPLARVAPFADIRQLGSLLQRAGFALPVADIVRHRLRYDGLSSLMRELRRLGRTNYLKDRQKTFSRRDTFLEAERYYADNFANRDGRVTATLELAVLTGWAPHASQPQPLRPASAEVSLATVLTTSRPKNNQK